MFGIQSCQMPEKNREKNKTNLTNVKGDFEKKEEGKYYKEGFFEPTCIEINLNKSYHFANLELWPPDKYDSTGTYELRFESKNPKPLYIKFINCIERSDSLILTDTDTLKGEIYFKGKFHKVIGDEGEVVTKKIIVLSGDLKIKKKNYKIDFAYFPGD